MHARHLRHGALWAALSLGSASAALAGASGHRGAAVFRPAVGYHGMSRGFGGARRGLPPISGVIHQRGGMRPYVSAYGHTGTALRGGGAYRPYAAGYGHLGTGLGGARRRFAGRGVFLGGGFGGIGGFGGLGYGYGAGAYGAPGLYGDAGVYGGRGTYGQSGSYGGTGTTATQSVYGNGGGVAYRSERPLAARLAEPPLGPSPYESYSPDDRYASGDAGPAPRVVRVHRAATARCLCGPRVEPWLLPYGIGTAY